MVVKGSEPDIDFLNFIDLGITRSNSSARIKRVADFVFSDNENGGVSEAINRFVLN